MAKKRGQGEEVATPKKRKRGQGEGSIFYIESKKLWCAKITTDRDANGRQKRREFYGKTRKEVQEKLTAAVNEINTDTYIEPSKITVSQWVDVWLLDYKKKSVKPRTFMTYWDDAKNHIKPMLGEYKLKDIRNDILQRFVNDLDNKGLASKTINRIYAVLIMALRQAVSNQLISRSIELSVKLPKTEVKERKVLSPEEQKRFIEVAKKTLYGEVFICILGTGLRIGEILALTWDDVDFNEQIVKINKSCQFIKGIEDEKRKIQVGDPKSKAGNRIIPLLPSIITLLKDVRKKSIEYRIKLGESYQNNNLVFCSHLGTYLSRSDMLVRVQRIAGEAGIEGIGNHSLRHTFATRGLEQGIDLKIMQMLLGHSSISMTADLYTHTKKNAMKNLQDTINL